MQLHHVRVRRRWRLLRYVSVTGYAVLIALLVLLFLVGLRIGRAEAASVRLEWDYVQSTAPEAQADSFTVERCTGTGCANFVPITTTPLPITTLTYSDTTVQAGQTYQWIVRAKGPSGVSLPSNSVSFRVFDNPQAPRNLRAIFVP